MLRKLMGAITAGLAAVVSAVAKAAVPTEVQNVFTEAATDFATVLGYGWTLFLVIVGGLIVFTLVKKVIAKAVGR